MLSIEPVERLSRTKTSSPRSSSASAVGAYESGSSGYQHTQRSVLLRRDLTSTRMDTGFRRSATQVRRNGAEAIGKLRTAATT